MFLSIITVTRNNASGLKLTGRSIDVQQNTPEFEWIVIDGASTDNTKDIVALFPELEPIFVSEADRGIYDAMNKGIARAHGDYIWFLNAGDCLPDMNTLRDVEREIKTNGRPDFVFGDAREDGNLKEAHDMDAFPNGQITHHQAMIYARKPLGELRYDTKYKIAGDYDFTLRFISEATRFHYINRIMCDFQSGGISQTNAIIGRQENFEIRENLGLVSNLRNRIIFNRNAFASAFKEKYPKLFWSLRLLMRPPSNRKTLSQWRSENPAFRPKPLFSRRKNR